MKLVGFFAKITEAAVACPNGRTNLMISFGMTDGRVPPRRARAHRAAPWHLGYMQGVFDDSLGTCNAKSSKPYELLLPRRVQNSHFHEQGSTFDANAQSAKSKL